MRLILLTCAALLAFAGNSVLCRLALRETSLDAASFTSLRIVSGALVLWLIVWARHLVAGAARLDTQVFKAGSWWSAIALFVYAAGFSFAYIELPTAAGALILFGCVQATMIGYDLWCGARLAWLQILGLILALVGLVILLVPSADLTTLFQFGGSHSSAQISAAAAGTQHSLNSSLLMVAAGIAWGFYSLYGKQLGKQGKTAKDPTLVTAGNFLRAIPFALCLSFYYLAQARFDELGWVYAILSGAITSGLGYALWYSALPSLSATQAASLQLTVPMLAALGGVLFLGELMSLQLLLASCAILGGVGLVLWRPKTR